MTCIKYDFNSCYKAYNFSQFDDEQIDSDTYSDELNDLGKEILQSLLSKCGIEISNHLFLDFLIR